MRNVYSGVYLAKTAPVPGPYLGLCSAVSKPLDFLATLCVGKKGIKGTHPQYLMWKMERNKDDLPSPPHTLS